MRKYNLIRSLAIALGGTCLFISCKKEGTNDNPQVTPSANVVVVHAAPVPAGYPALDVFIDTGRFTPGALAYLGNNQATGITGNLLYAPALAAESHQVDARPAGNPGVKVLNTTTALDASTNYSLFIYDTLSTTTNQFKLLKLTDDISQPADTSMGKIRMLHLAPTLPAYDFVFVRLVGTTAVDSVTFSNRAYVGSTTPNEATLSAFTALKGGIYRLKIKVPGTQTIIATANNGATNYLNYAKGKAYTVLITGNAKGQPLALLAIRHS